jgi:thiol-disulfide isomerase/thioredoxin
MKSGVKKNNFRIIFLVLWLGIGLEIKGFAQGEFHFGGNIEAIFEEAEKGNFPFIIEIKTSWCGYCKKFERTTLKDNSVIEFLEKENIRFLAVDGEKGSGRTFANKNNVKGYPSIFLFSPAGKLIKRVDGYQSPSGFLLSLKEFISSMGFSGPTLEYINLKSQYFDSLYSVDVLWPERHFLQAYSFAVKQDQKSMTLLELDLDGNDLLMTKLVYNIYANQSEAVPALAWKCLEAGVLNEKQQHFLSFYIIRNNQDFNLSHQLINQSIRKKKSLGKLDTRAGIQFLSGNLRDARSTLREIKKNSSKSIPVPGTFYSLEAMIMEKEK